MKEIREELNNIRNVIIVILDSIDKIENKLGPAVPEKVGDGVNWSSADTGPKKAGVYMKDIKELTDVKEQVIIGQISQLGDTSSFIKGDGTKGLVKSFTIEDPSGDLLVVLWDDQTAKLDGYMIGEYIQITNAWKVKLNKHGKHELHPGKFFKIVRVA